MKALVLALGLSLVSAPALFAQPQGEDEYIRIELLGAVNGAANTRSTYDVSVTEASRTTYVLPGVAGPRVSDIAVIDRMTGQSLKFAVAGTDLRVTLARP